MNLDIEQLPAACDVLVVGAGPAGSAAAQLLARGGRDVVLIDQHAFPRDKACGDGLIPDAHEALRRLSVWDAVMGEAQPARFVRCVGPRGGRIDVPAMLAVLPRRRLDEIVCRAAVAAGARMFAPLRFIQPLEDGDAVVGARLQHGEVTRELRARWVVLATGAVPQALLAAGMALRHTPSGVALRGYVKHEAPAASINALEVVWHRTLAPGYGWIFPCPGGVFNIGVGTLDRPTRQPGGEANLRQVFDDFTRIHTPARELLAGGTLLGPLKGAPLRCTLEGARLSRPGLLVTGEAAGSTYSFTGEGIGKALETGIHAAQALLAGARQGDAVVRADYEARLLALKPRFDLYAQANRANRHPWLADLVIWRARRSARLRQRLAGVLDETRNPGDLFTARGLLHLFTE
ncbi:NAD(P)/FAD-dependent oxidoreductase [Rhodoferax sediminis]|uniref:Geranylgeranyl reductase family protein n=1 Tax=Rhodoferax sediminis TaxID=2509614 RepID=A0A515DFJ5_9BURK|nr:geranylgeranyl reductase family protein [Rhodoferax sediminis]QDL39175.1 geranylgeranyl reductase family protein [Rhodoferax sediminis]